MFIHKLCIATYVNPVLEGICSCSGLDRIFTLELLIYNKAVEIIFSKAYNYIVLNNMHAGYVGAC